MQFFTSGRRNLHQRYSCDFFENSIYITVFVMSFIFPATMPATQKLLLWGTLTPPHFVRLCALSCSLCSHLAADLEPGKGRAIGNYLPKQRLSHELRALPLTNQPATDHSCWNTHASHPAPVPPLLSPKPKVFSQKMAEVLAVPLSWHVRAGCSVSTLCPSPLLISTWWLGRVDGCDTWSLELSLGPKTTLQSQSLAAIQNAEELFLTASYRVPSEDRATPHGPLPNTEANVLK
jgi:hypothetical protein